METDDANTGPPGARRSALALPEGESAGGAGLTRIDEVRPRNEQRHSDASYRGGSANSGKSNRRQDLSREAATLRADFRRACRRSRPARRGLEQSSRLSPVAGILRSPGSV